MRSGALYCAYYNITNLITTLNKILLSDYAEIHSYNITWAQYVTIIQYMVV